ncbi:MAG: protein kinase, partial [Acidobacteriota bacterium]|nr:protein kinase [Acidobacteriota bacterium]
VLAKIREGGMGAIYKVRHRLLNELRVIKVMRPEVAQSSEQRKRFLREAQTATRLRHTNIVAFHDFFIDEEDTAYMVMEYIEGINLRDMVREFGPFPIPLALDVSRQCLSAFEYLHRKGVVHRDVSPDNVMMTREDDGVVRAKLIDLGIAKIAQAKEELTGADEFIGKLRYSSPEQLTSSAQIDARSDLFSFGIVLYEILTGVRPYGGETIHEIVANRLNQPPLPFETTDPNGRLSPAVREAVLKALRTKPDERYQSAAEFSKRLEALGTGDIQAGVADGVAGYTDKAMALALKVAAAAEVVGGDLNAPVKELFGTGGSRPSASDVKFRTSIARWADATPAAPDPQGKTLRLASPDDPTVMPALPHDWSAARTRPATGPTEPQDFGSTGRKSPVAGYLGAAALAALLIGFGVWIAGRDKTSAALDVPAGGTVTTDRPYAPPVPTAPVGEPARKSDSETDREAAKPAAPPAENPPAAGLATDPAPTPKSVARARPTAAPRVALLRPTSVPRPKETGPETASAAPPSRSGPKMSYCLQQDDTVFKQGVVRDVPTGFGDIATKAPRPDSGLMRMIVSLSAQRPDDDQPFFVIVRFENGGDSRVDVQRLEESSSRGGLRSVSGASVPVSVSPGGMKELHRYPLTLSGGEPYGKQFVAVDSKGDSWKTGLRIVPCGD